MDKIKVANIITDTNIGGAGKCIITFAKNYDKDKFELTVIIPKGSLLKKELEPTGVHIIEADDIADESMSIKGIMTQKKLLKALNCDIVHTHAALSARIAARLAGAKGIVYTRHCVYEPTGFMKSFIGKLINRIISELFSDKIIAVAAAAADNLTDVGISKKKINIILNGIEPLTPLSEDEKKKQRERFGVGGGQKVVSLVARLETVKGHDDYIEASKILKKRNVNVKLIAAGNGSRENELKKTEDVYFTGFIPDAFNLIGITDISANASFGTEATSISLLEGMSLGIPAVVTDYGGNPGVIADGENGLLVPTHNGVQLADAIEKILCDEALYNKLSAGAKKIFAEKFTAQAMSRQIEAVYSALMGGK